MSIQTDKKKTFMLDEAIDKLSSAIVQSASADLSGDQLATLAALANDLKDQNLHPIKKLSIILKLYKDLVHPELLKQEMAKLSTIRNLISESSND